MKKITNKSFDSLLNFIKPYKKQLDNIKNLDIILGQSENWYLYHNPKNKPYCFYSSINNKLLKVIFLKELEKNNFSNSFDILKLKKYLKTLEQQDKIKFISDDIFFLECPKYPKLNITIKEYIVLINSIKKKLKKFDIYFDIDLNIIEIDPKQLNISIHENDLLILDYKMLQFYSPEKLMDGKLFEYNIKDEFIIYFYYFKNEFKLELFDVGTTETIPFQEISELLNKRLIKILNTFKYKNILKCFKLLANVLSTFNYNNHNIKGVD